MHDLRAGAESGWDYSSRWSLDFVMDYSMARVTSRDPGTPANNVGVLSSEATVLVPLDDAWHLTGGFRYYRADEEEQVYTRNKLSGITLGIVYEDAAAP